MRPAGAICEIVNDDGTMTRGEDLDTFCDTHGLHKLAIADLVRYRRWQTPVVASEAIRLPTPHGVFEATAFSDADGAEHLVLSLGDVADHDDVLVRVHSECLTGDVFGSGRCDCGPQLDRALAEIAQVGSGVVIYLRGHEGRGIGLVQKLRAYGLQEHGYDTVDANVALGLPVDARDYAVAAKILAQLRICSVNLMTNNPAKETALAGLRQPDSAYHPGARGADRRQRALPTDQVRSDGSPDAGGGPRLIRHQQRRNATTLATLITQHRVHDFDVWRSAFAGHQDNRRSHGATGHRIYRVGDDVTVLTDFPDRAAAQRFLEPPTTRIAELVDSDAY